jgi:NAD(P)-dependent dehydrogenase (short-subunit alcohol dehydrogenase family)
MKKNAHLPSFSGIGKEADDVLAADGWKVVATMRSLEKEQDLVPSDNLMLTRLDLQNAFVKRVYDQTGLDN